MTGKSTVRVDVDPGICGFTCCIEVFLREKRTAHLEISETECDHIRRLNEQVTEITLKELFMPLGRHPIFVAAERAGCHPACPIPSAMVKAVEVAMGMALPKPVRIEFID